MLCERCGASPATTQVTELVGGAFQDSLLCQDCARPLSLRSEADSRCLKCGTEIDEEKLGKLLSSLKLGKEGWTKEVWTELQALAACPICGERLGLPQIPFELLPDPTIQLELTILARHRPPKQGPLSAQ